MTPIYEQDKSLQKTQKQFESINFFDRKID